jgi:hypothetical protein
LCHTDVQWLIHGAVLKCFLALRLEIEMFMSLKGKVMADFSDEKLLRNLVLLCDISHYIKDLNKKLQGQQTHF